jgi:hypothetical protein
LLILAGASCKQLFELIDDHKNASGARYLHIDVEFDPKTVPGHLFSPEDVVVETSKLYVDYSAKD